MIWLTRILTELHTSKTIPNQPLTLVPNEFQFINNEIINPDKVLDKQVTISKKKINPEPPSLFN